MTVAGWVTLSLCWLLVSGFSLYFIVKTLRAPQHKAGDDAGSQPEV